MAKLYIAKNRYGGYYVKVKNKYLKCEKIVAANLPEGVELAKDYGWFDCDYFLSCFKKSNGEIELVFKITKIVGGVVNVTNPDINPEGTQSVSAYQEYESATDDLPF